MLSYIVFSLLVFSVKAENKPEARIVHLEGVGSVSGTKYWDGEFFEFLGVPYATAPRGADKFKAPLPVPTWEGVREAKNMSMCPQIYFEDDPDALYGDFDCLHSNFMVPKIASKTNLVPVIVYVHSGGFSGGGAHIAKYHHLAHQDIIVASFNYRVGGVGFACLGTDEIPGNAALKDIIAALKFIKKHIKSFGGDPDNITLAGYSVGATLADLVAISKQSDGLFDKLSLDSGSALAPYAINRNPIHTATNVAISLGYEDTGNIEDLNKFLLSVNTTRLAANSRNFFLKNSTFGFAPCIEKPSPNAVITESPLDIMLRGDYGNFGIIAGFSNMEGISRTYHINDWSIDMNNNFADYLPADLKFKDDKERDAVVKEIKQFYFKDKEISLDTAQEYINYFSASMFKYGIMRSLLIHREKLQRDMYLYEFSYVGKLGTKHQFMDKISGASHRDLSAYILDFYDWTRNFTDMDMKDKLTMIWGDYVKIENPTPYENALFTFKWPKFTVKEPFYVDIGAEFVAKKNLFHDEFQFWDNFYKKYYWSPTTVDPDAFRPPPKEVKKPVKAKTTKSSQEGIKTDASKSETVDKKTAQAESVDKKPAPKLEVKSPNDARKPEKSASKQLNPKEADEKEIGKEAKSK